MLKLIILKKTKFFFVAERMSFTVFIKQQKFKMESFE